MAISEVQRRRVSRRAHGRCEYCLLYEEHSVKKHEPDHIIPRKHGGLDLDDNLAWACFLCNRSKGSEVAAYDSETGQLVPLFNPRKQVWAEHFSMQLGEIIAHTAVGRVTILVLQLNQPRRVETRRILIESGL